MKEAGRLLGHSRCTCTCPCGWRSPCPRASMRRRLRSALHLCGLFFLVRSCTGLARGSRRFRKLLALLRGKSGGKKSVADRQRMGRPRRREGAVMGKVVGGRVLAKRRIVTTSGFRFFASFQHNTSTPKVSRFVQSQYADQR
jgi:hypothetical protein